MCYHKKKRRKKSGGGGGGGITIAAAAVETNLGRELLLASEFSDDCNYAKLL
jgi:cephalosporin-C deacetylase-like acetyl esterase